MGRLKQLPLSANQHITVNGAMGHAQRTVVGLRHRDVDKALDEYHKMPTPETKAAYVDMLLQVLDGRMQTTWPVIYEALSLVEKYRYADNKSGFEGYIRDKLGITLGTWKELEQTYQYVHRVEPELFGKTYDEARSRTARYAENPRPLATQSEAQKGNLNAWRVYDVNSDAITKNDGSNQNNGFSHKPKRGESADYLTARIARDRPDILEQMKQGIYRSVRAAAIDAGIIDPEKSKRHQLPTDPAAAGRYLAQRVDSEWMLECYDAFMKHTGDDIE